MDVVGVFFVWQGSCAIWRLGVKRQPRGGAKRPEPMGVLPHAYWCRRLAPYAIVNVGLF